MNIKFTVGKQETHAVEFRWGRFFGTTKVLVDGRVALSGMPVVLDELNPLTHFRMLCEVLTKGDVQIKLLRTWDLPVGRSEVHAVSIVKERPRVLAGFRPSNFWVFVDGELILERKGY